MDTNETKTHWKKLVDPRFIGAYALPNGDDITVTIERVQLETVKMMGGKNEDHTICHLRGQKPMILNVTNSKSIHKLYGPFIEDWAGKQITLFASTAKMGGELVECLRIRPSVASKKPTVLTDARFKAALAGIKANTYTAEKLRAAAALTDAQEEALKAALKEPEGETA
jgi:hypothetical protein